MASIEIWQDQLEGEFTSEMNFSSTMLSSSRKYNLGTAGAVDKIKKEICQSPAYKGSESDIYSLELIPDLFRKAQKLSIIAAYQELYLYDHGGISISTSPFSCPWDSGQYGIAYITKEEARDILNIKRVNQRAISKLEAMINSEVEFFDKYLREGVFGFTIFDDKKNVIDSCGGYIGRDPIESGMKDAISDEYHEILLSA